MMDLGLYLVSGIVLLLLLSQIYLPEAGDGKHRLGGKLAMAWGAILVVLVAIRGAGQEVFTAWYIAHLVLGSVFFIALFATGFMGWRLAKAETTSLFLPLGHWLGAKTALYSLLATLALGVVSVFFH